MSRSAPASVAAESLWGDLASDTQTLRALAFMRGLTLAAGSAASGAVAGAGLAVLLFLAATITFAPANDTFSRQLSLDFAPHAADLVGEAVFLPEPQSADGLLPHKTQSDARFLSPQQPVDVWLELQVPRSSGRGVVHVVAKLTSLDGRVAAKSSHAALVHSEWWSPGSLALAPLRWLGLVSSCRMVRVTLFTGYREKAEVPFMTAHVAIKTRNPTASADVLSATIKVQLRLGFIRRAIYTLRPRSWVLFLVGCTAVAALLGGGTAAMLCLGLLLYTGFGGVGGGRGAAAEGAEDASSVLAEEDQQEQVEVSSVSGVSEASSSLLREIEQELEAEGAELEPPLAGQAPSTSMPARAAADIWRNVLPEAGSSIAGGGRRPARKAGGPADSAMGREASWGWGALRRRGEKGR